jgi:hypothetical protein
VFGVGQDKVPAAWPAPASQAQSQSQPQPQPQSQPQSQPAARRVELMGLAR